MSTFSPHFSDRIFEDAAAERDDFEKDLCPGLIDCDTFQIETESDSNAARAQHDPQPAEITSALFHGESVPIACVWDSLQALANEDDCEPPMSYLNFSYHGTNCSCWSKQALRDWS